MEPNKSDKRTVETVRTVDAAARARRADPDTPQERRLAAIMFSDICGYSRIMGRNEKHAMQLLARHDAMVAEAMTQFDGHIIKRMGDGFLAEFRSAVSAVECAIAIQRRMMSYNQTAAESDVFQLRIGVHLGDVVVTDNDILGDGVNVAARIEPLAPPGGICISQDIYNQVLNKVEMQVVALEPTQLKNIERQIGIYRVLLAAAVPSPPIPSDRRTSGRLKAWRWRVAAVLIALLVVALLLLGRSQKRRVHDRELVQTALTGAETLIAAHKPVEAQALLEKTIAEARPQTPGLDQVQVQLESARDEVQKEKITARHARLIDAIYRKDWETCLTIMVPETRLRHSPQGLKLRLQFLRAAAEAGRWAPNDIRIKAIQLNPQRDKASVIQELCTKGTWNEMKPAYWRRTDDNWFLFVEPPADNDAGSR